MKNEQNMKTTVYISGKITGEHYITCWHKFEKAENELIADGYKVINPMKLVKPTWSWLRCMVKCIWVLIFKTDAIYLLPDWKDSKGARIEKKIADKLNINEFSYEKSKKI